MIKLFRLVLIGLLLLLSACDRPEATTLIDLPTAASVINVRPTSSPLPTHDPAKTPTPDPTRTIDARQTELYIVQSGDTLANIAAEYGTTPEDIAKTNGLDNIQMISVGEPLNVPIKLERNGPHTKLIPDAELVYGPSTVGFDVETFVNQTHGYLRNYAEQIDGETLTGAQIVQRVAEQFSVNPRLLLAVIEYRGQWLSSATPDADSQSYPAGHKAVGTAGLYLQLSWAANHLNDGYYGWKYRAQQTIRFVDDTRARVAAGLNAGTVGVQTMLALDRLYDDWQQEIGPQGFIHTYQKLFGDPFNYSVEIVPKHLEQPPLSLPWTKGEKWYFTGGPHGGWVSGSGWAAIDFIPEGPELGCQMSDRWAVAMSPGTVVRSRNGEVMVDMDDDGHEQTGWEIFYMHMAGEDRVEVGAQVHTGDRIGHPSCEGGLSTATHLHIARKYNGEWMPAAGSVPFVLEGWRVTGEATEYDGGLINGVQVKVACECRDDVKNGITR
jgi:LysM repeat protein